MSKFLKRKVEHSGSLKIKAMYCEKGEGGRPHLARSRTLLNRDIWLLDPLVFEELYTGNDQGRELDIGDWQIVVQGLEVV